MEAYTLEQYTEFLNSLNIYDEFQIKISYRIYLALESGDENEIRKANINNWYNAYYRSSGRFN
jgi:hypothetical protein